MTPVENGPLLNVMTIFGPVGCDRIWEGRIAQSEALNWFLGYTGATAFISPAIAW
jgi:hypothetical protein